MNRLLWATIAGLILGAIAFGMMQRGCDADGADEPDRRLEAPSEHDFPAGPRGVTGARPDGSGPRILIRSDDRGRTSTTARGSRRDVRNPPRGGDGAYQPPNRARTQAPRDAASSAAGDRPSRFNSGASSGRSGSGRSQPGSVVTNRPTRTPSSFRNSGRADLGPDLSPAELERRRRLRNARENERSRIAQEAQEAQEAFRASLTEPDEADERDGGRRERSDDDGGSGASGDSNSDRDNSSSDDNGPRPFDNRPGINNTPNSGRSPGGAGVAGPTLTVGAGISTGGGDGGNGDSGGNGGNGGDDGATPPPSGGDDGGGGDPTPPPSGGNDAGPPPPPTVVAPGVSAQWAPADTPNCADLDGFRSADLFLAFDSPSLVTLVTSPPDQGLTVSGGRLFQDTTFGGNTPPASGALAAIPCLASDSFLTLGGGAPSFVPGGEPDPADWGETLNATWFSVPPAPAEPEPEKFGDGRFYVWVGRFSAGGEDVGIEGLLFVNHVNLISGESQSTPVLVSTCDDCWEGADGALPPADLTEIAAASDRVTSGQSITAEVRLSNPAPPEGVVVTLNTDTPEVIEIPTSVTVPGGENSASFSIDAAEIERDATVKLMASAAGIEVETELRVQTLRPVSVAAEPGVVQAGREALFRVTLNGPAPAGGIVLTVLGDASVDQAIDLPNNIQVPAGNQTVEFTAQTHPVVGRRTIRLLVAYREIGAFGSVILEGVSGDLTGDGAVGAADLANLLGSWGPCPPGGPCPGDLNGDGQIGADDLAALLGNWGTPDDTGGPEEPTEDGPVIARWIAVDNSACEETASLRTADLYLGFDAPSRVTNVDSGGDVAIEIEGGSFYQNEFGSNRAPGAGIEDVIPCLAFDSYLAIEGEAAPPPQIAFTPGGAPNPSDWGSTLNAGWFVTSNSPGVRNPGFFGDGRYYTRIGRFTAEAEASVGGMVRVFFIDATAGNTVASSVVGVPDWTVARASLDVNEDGRIDSDDVASMMRRIGAESPGDGEPLRGDLNRDGKVDSADLRLLLSELSGRAP